PASAVTNFTRRSGAWAARRSPVSAVTNSTRRSGTRAVSASASSSTRESAARIRPIDVWKGDGDRPSLFFVSGAGKIHHGESEGSQIRKDDRIGGRQARWPEGR